MKPINPELLKRLAEENRRNADRQAKLIENIRRENGEIKPRVSKLSYFHPGK
jgi:hypothetical protein